eukprot:CAMPEP_0195157508 /NCGR_PEP_ID=MMETSP0448-20130528/185198_1 /TAXON_ID=66468 /ORGANISM="Heterocapsa triquestra, Strain CCMP 448" /LENGTH=102 /DNA_ID=CAMNT_0040196303 /DNA_START=1512 /DNA_END=1820 /DNA_ORIENTATION=-
MVDKVFVDAGLAVSVDRGDGIGLAADAGARAEIVVTDSGGTITALLFRVPWIFEIERHVSSATLQLAQAVGHSEQAVVDALQRIGDPVEWDVEANLGLSAAG